MDESRFFISPETLYARMGTAAAPILIDVRRQPTFDDADRMIAGALRRPPDTVAAWRQELPAGGAVVVYCAHGLEIGQGVAAALRAGGADARYLQGGISAWADAGLPQRLKTPAPARRWVTRKRPKIDRIACPWLIRRFIDPEAEFLYVPADRVLDIARESGAVAYDIPGAEPFSHDGAHCSFDGFLKTFGISDPALDRLALIVRGADTGHPELAPQSAGLLAVSLGLSANFADDQAMLAEGLVLYDALYAWCRSLQSETHTWKPAA